MNAIEIIRKKREKKILTEMDLSEFIRDICRGEIPDYQISSWLMAVFLNGMNLDETASLSQLMTNSGKRVKFSNSKPKVDKHSTGGVGDKVSIILAPLVASLGVDCPMVSGRGLGHTGGTTDKLESIPGFRTSLKLEEFASIVEKIGVCMMTQTQELAPADKILYAIRDVTATVESIPLITASILSKKVAEGITGLVLDIKTGNGAFMKTQRDAEALAKSLTKVGKKMGLKIRALITDMNQPLGNTIGNTIEINECIDVLNGEGPADLKEITIELAAHMAVLGEKFSSLSAARNVAKKNLNNGLAFQVFQKMCKAQGSQFTFSSKESKLPIAKEIYTFFAPKSGTLSKIDTEAVGNFLVELGGGRKKLSDKIDHTVGMRIHAKLGDSVKKGAPLLTIYANNFENTWKKTIEGLFTVTAQKPKTVLSSFKLIKKVIQD
ncbi:MAG: thymidine phosphorylase [Bacteriovoracia bacterium]